jgi:hypothetical protein
VMQVKGGKQVTLTPGQTFYGGPDDVHVVDRNASSTKPAKFLVLKFVPNETDRVLLLKRNRVDQCREVWSARPHPDEVARFQAKGKDRRGALVPSNQYRAEYGARGANQS